MSSAWYDGRSWTCLCVICVVVWGWTSIVGSKEGIGKSNREFVIATNRYICRRRTPNGMFDLNSERMLFLACVQCRHRPMAGQYTSIKDSDWHVRDSEVRFDDLKGQRMSVLACVTDPSQVNTRRPRPPRLRCSLRSNYLKGQRMLYLACVIDRSLVGCLGLLTCDTWYWTASVDGSHSRVTRADTPLTATETSYTVRTSVEAQKSESQLSECWEVGSGGKWRDS